MQVHVVHQELNAMKKRKVDLLAVETRAAVGITKTIEQLQTV